MNIKLGLIASIEKDQVGLSLFHLSYVPEELGWISGKPKALNHCLSRDPIGWKGRELQTKTSSSFGKNAFQYVKQWTDWKGCFLLAASSLLLNRTHAAFFPWEVVGVNHLGGKTSLLFVEMGRGRILFLNHRVLQNNLWGAQGKGNLPWGCRRCDPLREGMAEPGGGSEKGNQPKIPT